MKRTVNFVSHHNAKEKVVAYVRISSKTQERGFGRELQIKAIMDFCEIHKGEMELEKIYVDSAVSGTEKGMSERHAFFDMLKFCESNGPTKVIVYDLSRLWRCEISSAITKRELKKRHATIISLQQPQYSLDSESPSEFLISSIFENLATFSRMEIRDKLRKGIEAKIAKNGWPGCGIPLGFVVSKDKELIVCEKELNIVSFIFRKKRAGWSTYKIAKVLRENGVVGKKGGEIMPATVRKVLSHAKTYRGYWTFAKKHFPNKLGKVI